MVMLLPSPCICSEQFVADVVAERAKGKNAKFFAGIESEWQLRVRDYIDQKGSPEKITTWPKIEHKSGSFLNLYSHPAEGSVQEAMLRGLRKHGLQLCPACGEAGAPNTLDHYLPKRRYPHFCVTPHNLFPMCDACQANKGEKTGDSENPKYFLHPYFDIFVGKQVIRLCIDPPFDKPAFRLGVVKDLLPLERRLVQTHIEELNITERYAVFFRAQYLRVLRLVKSMRESHQDVRKTLKAFLRAYEEPSKNAWEHVFYEAVLSNDAMVKYLRKGKLPKYL